MLLKGTLQLVIFLPMLYSYRVLLLILRVAISVCAKIVLEELMSVEKKSEQNVTNITSASVS